MEGFLDFSLPVWQRVLITRSIAIVPAILVTFFNVATLDSMDNALNILQSIQLPFALVPLIKFVSDRQILGPFTLPPWQKWFSTIFGCSLFLMNFIIILDGDILPWYIYVLIAIMTCIYGVLIFKAIREPVGPLKIITEEEMEDHEYK